ncbi:hypothetical protein [Candidatus Palauibacter irciniicola]|uniref:hypothetical protein n=1 Tax=Candidatus Palauibacter irciniicola TaxID=3056733 RepID=UPI003B01C84E
MEVRARRRRCGPGAGRERAPGEPARVHVRNARGAGRSRRVAALPAQVLQRGPALPRAARRLYLPFVGALDSAAEHRRWLASVGDAWEDLFELHFAAARAAGEPRAERYLEATRERVREERQGEPALDLAGLAVKGDDLLALGMSPGPLVRLLLEELLEQVLEDPGRNERETLLEEARRLIEIGALAEASRPPDADD